MYYRFKNGIFVKAETFEEAKAKLVQQITAETEHPKRWYKCTCIGFEHRFGCPQKVQEPIPY